jgi:hypothetical protein
VGDGGVAPPIFSGTWPFFPPVAPVVPAPVVLVLVLVLVLDPAPAFAFAFAFAFASSSAFAGCVCVCVVSNAEFAGTVSCVFGAGELPPHAPIASAIAASAVARCAGALTVMGELFTTQTALRHDDAVYVASRNLARSVKKSVARG